MATPLVSICLPNLNTRPFLEERMATIMAQTMPDWELIVCDSYSNDGSWEFFQQFKNDPRIHLHQVPREGIYPGWNECLKRALGEFIHIATSDDTSAPNFLETMLAPLQHLPHVDVAICQTTAIDEKSQPVDAKFLRLAKEFFGDWMQTPCLRNGRTEFLIFVALSCSWYGIQSVLFRNRLLQKLGYFRTDCRWLADLDWDLRLCLATDLAFVPNTSASWRIRQGQATPKGAATDDTRLWLDILNSVLHDGRAAIPAEWRRVPNWEQQISAVAHVEYLDSFGLDRSIARKSPGQFLKNISSALRREPGFLFEQSCRGFAGSARFSPDRLQVARQLIETFQAQWPPTRMTADWQPANLAEVRA